MYQSTTKTSATKKTLLLVTMLIAIIMVTVRHVLKIKQCIFLFRLTFFFHFQKRFFMIEKTRFSDNIPSRQYCRCISGWTGATCDQQEVQTELYSFFKRTVRLVGLNPGG